MSNKGEGRIGIFGGSFNPVHIGHLNSLRTVCSREKLKKIFVVPNSQNPLKESSQTIDGKHRVAMLNLAFKDDPQFVVDEQEIKRGGKSYTIETLRYYKSQYPHSEIVLIIGSDSFEFFDKWKNFDEILSEVSLVVTSRPNFSFPYSKEDLPPGIQDLVKEIDYKGLVKIKGGNTIKFLQLDDIDTSSTQIRKNLKLRRQVGQFLSYEVEKYIQENNLYPPLTTKIPDFLEFTKFCSQILFDRKALNVKAYDLSESSAPSEFSIIASGTSTRQTQSFGEQIARRVKEEFGVAPLVIEGAAEGRWVVLDYGSLIIHLFYDFVRNEYRMEELWKKSKEVELNLK